MSDNNNNNNLYYEKYMKYKLKYNQLNKIISNQKGGMNPSSYDWQKGTIEEGLVIPKDLEKTRASEKAKAEKSILEKKYLENELKIQELEIKLEENRNKKIKIEQLMEQYKTDEDWGKRNDYEMNSGLYNESGVYMPMQ